MKEPIGDSLPFAEPAKPLILEIAMNPAPVAVAAATKIHTPAEIVTPYRYRNKPLPIDSLNSKIFTRDNALYVDVRIPAHVANTKSKRMFFRLDKITETIAPDRTKGEEFEAYLRTSYKVGRFDERDVEYRKTADGKFQPIRHGVYRRLNTEQTKLFVNALTHQIEQGIFELCDVDVLMRNLSSWVIDLEAQNQKLQEALAEQQRADYDKAKKAGKVKEVPIPDDPLERAQQELLKRRPEAKATAYIDVTRLKAACTHRWPHLFPALFEEMNPSVRVNQIQQFVADFPEYKPSAGRWVDDVIREVAPSEKRRLK